MSTLTGIFGVQHNPMLWRTLADPKDDDLIALRDAYAASSQRLLAMRPDVVVVIATDHLTQWFYENMPTFLVGKAERIPATFHNEEREFGLPRAELRGHLQLAAWLHEDGLRRGVDFASSEDFRADHSIFVPLHFLTPALDVSIVPVFTNCIAPPLPSAERFFELGEVLRASIEACPLALRVVVVASGHLATEIGGPKHFAGSPDVEFDQEAVAMVGAGALDEVRRLATFERLRDAGNVTHQFLNFVAAMGVAAGKPADVAEARFSRFATSPFFEWHTP